MKRWLWGLASFGLWVGYHAPVTALETTSPPSHSAEPITLIPFEEEAYSLAFQSFLANGNTEQAYLVAASAVEQQPDNLTWRKRLAEVASWVNRPRVSMRNWLYIGLATGDEQALQKAKAIAQAFNDHFTLLKLLQRTQQSNPENIQNNLDLADTYEKLGEPEKAFELLNKANETNPQRDYLQALAKLNQNIRNNEEEIKILKKISANYGLTTPIALRLAELLYNQGKISKSFDELLAAKEIAPKDNDTYWRTLGDLAWFLQNKKLAQLAYQRLNQNKTIKPEEIRRLILLWQTSAPKAALALAVQSWQSTRQPTFFELAVEMALRQQQWNTLKSLFNSLTAKEERELQQTASILPLKARMHLQLGEIDQANNAFKRALQLQPNNMALKRDYLWFLIDTKNKVQVIDYLQKLGRMAYQTPELWQPAAAGFLLTDNDDNALLLYQKILASPQADYKTLISLAEILTRKNNLLLARELQQRALAKLRMALIQADPASRKELMNDYFQLSLAGRPSGDQVSQALSFACHDSLTTSLDEQLLSWALSNQNQYLAEYLQACRDWGDTPIPVYAQLSTALPLYHLEAMQRLLENYSDELPLSDRVLAAERLGDFALAQDLAYDGLMQDPDNALLYKLMTDVFLKTANVIDIRTEYRQFGTIAGPRTRMRLRYHLNTRWFIEPNLMYWDPRTLDKEQVFTTFSPDRQVGVNIGYRSLQSTTLLSLGLRDAMDWFANAKLSQTRRWNERLNSLVSLGYQQAADENANLYMSGMKNNTTVAFNYGLTASDRLAAEAEVMQFLTQDNQQTIGYGNAITLRYDHVIWADYSDWRSPDLAMAIFGSTHHYSRRRNVTGKALQLLPPDTTPGPGFLIPVNYSTYGASVYFGQAYRDEYTHLFRPFGELSLFKDTTSPGMSYLANIGFATSVFGRDHFSVYLSQGSNQADATQLDRLFGVRYQYYLY